MTLLPEADLFVIGAGSGGVRAARMAAQRGARVVVAEQSALGGTCVNLGCIPKKLYSYASQYAEAFEEARGFGWRCGEPAFDWHTLRANRAIEITRLNGVYERLLLGAGVTLLRGRARITGFQEVVVTAPDGTLTAVRARHILVATGGRPTTAGVPGGELAIVSDDVFDLPVLPRRMAVIGAGYIACEMASIFQGLGVKVTQVVRGQQVLRGFDEDVAGFLEQEQAKKGLKLRLSTQVERIDPTAEGLALTLDDGSVLPVDVALYATGRRPNTEGLGLVELGVQMGERGEVIVDEHYGSSVPSILAVGDVTDHVQLTPVALAEAMVVVDRLFGTGTRQMDYACIPTAVFTNPSIGTVGWSEAQAVKRHGRVRVYCSEFKPLRHTLSGSTERTFLKLVVDDASDRVVGLHMVGHEAGEIVQGFAVAIRAGVTKAQFDATIGIHPTVAEEFVTMREISRVVGLPLQPLEA